MGPRTGRTVEIRPETEVCTYPSVTLGTSTSGLWIGALQTDEIFDQGPLDLPELQVYVVLSGKTGIIKPVWSFSRLRRKPQKTKNQSLSPFVFCVFRHDLSDSKNLVWSVNQALAIYRALICLKETFSQGKEARIIDIFLASSARRASYEETSQGRNYHLLMISSSPDNTTFTCNVCLNKIWKGLTKDSTSLRDSHARSYEENVFVELHQVRFRRGKVHGRRGR